MADLSRIENLLEGIYTSLDNVKPDSKKPDNKKPETGSDKFVAASSQMSRTISRITTTMNGNIGGLINGIGDVAMMLPGWGKAIGAAIKVTGVLVESFISAARALNDYTNQTYKFNSQMLKAQLDAKYQQNEIMNQSVMDKRQYQIDMQLKKLELSGENYIQQIQVQMKQYAAAFETPFNSIIKGINEAAYEAMRQKIDVNIESKKLNRDVAIREKQLGYYGKTKETELESKLANNYGKQLEAEITRDTELTRLSAEKRYKLEEKYMVKAYHALSGNEPLAANIDDNSGLPESFGKTKDAKNILTPNQINKIFGGFNDFNWWDVMTGKADISMSQMERFVESTRSGLKFKNQEVSFQRSKLDQQTQFIENVGNKILDIAKRESDIRLDFEKKRQETFLNLTQTVEDWLNKFDKVTNDLAMSYGYTNKAQLDSFQNAMFVAGKSAIKYGKTPEELIKQQQQFIETTGRNKQFGEHDYNSMAALGNYLGDDGLAASYASGMEIFNAGVADSVDLLDEALQDVNRMGLNGRKYTKTLVDNLKLAEKYQFKGGTQGLMKMAKWAENTRFNLNSLAGMLDKISEGGLEGVITQGAQLQVLGGHAAMNADPIAMMFERYNNPDAFAKRMQDMTRGYGSLDRITGETTFSGTEQMLMENIAKAQGRSVEDVMNEVRARNKKEVIEKQLLGDFNDEEKSFISNLANYDKKSKQFKVKVKDGNQYLEKEVSQLTKDDIDNLMPEKHNERMEDYMQTVVSLLGKLAGEQTSQIQEIAENNYDRYKDNVKNRIEEAHKKFVEQYTTYSSMVGSTMDEITNNFSSFLDQSNAQNDSITGKNADILKAQEDLEKILKVSTVLFGENNNVMEEIVNRGKRIWAALEKIKLPEDVEKNETPQAPTAENAKVDKAASADVERMGMFALEKTIPMFGTVSNIFKAYKGIDNIFNTAQNTVKRNITKDGILSSNNTPIISNASNVTQINDGLVQSDPKDVAIFAKEGGVIGKFLNDLYGDVHSAMNGGGNVKFDTLKVEVNGKLDLSSGGMSVNIMNEIQNNPMLLRALSQMLAEQVTKALNGGRGQIRLNIGSI